MGMTITEVAQLLGSVVSTYMGIDPSRVVIKDETFDAPRDQGIYVLIEYQTTRVVGITSTVDTSTAIETMGQSTMEEFAIEVISRNRDAQDRFQEVIFALQSVAGQQSAEAAQCAFFRSTPPMDLSAVEGAAALHRYRIPVIVSNVQTKSAAIPMVDKFPANVTAVGA